MRQTNPKALRAELKDYLELATKEPLRINRRSGGSFILMNEEAFQQMQTEIVSLQRRLLGMSQIVAGDGKKYTPGDKSRLSRLKKMA